MEMSQLQEMMERAGCHMMVLLGVDVGEDVVIMQMEKSILDGVFMIAEVARDVGVRSSAMVLVEGTGVLSWNRMLCKRLWKQVLPMR